MEVDQDLPVNGTGDHELKLPVNGTGDHELKLHVNGTGQHELKLHVNGTGEHELKPNLFVNGTGEHELKPDVPVNGFGQEERWFPCPACDLMVTGLVRKGHPHPEKHAAYSYTHCCQNCEQGQKTHGEGWLCGCAGVPAALFRSVKLNGGTGDVQHYLLHDPGGDGLPVLLFLHGALEYFYPETVWSDVKKLVSNNQTLRENFIVIAPFGSRGEPIVHPSDWEKADRFYNRVPYVKCFNPDVTWDFFISALRSLQEEGRDLRQRFDPARLHVTGYSMGGQAAWSLAHLYGSRFASAAPMAASCAWEDDAWEQEANILGELGTLSLWTYAGKRDYRAVSWQDLSWLAHKRNKEKPTETTTSTGTGVQATIHTWSADLCLGLLEGTSTAHCIWDDVFHYEDVFQLFSRMLSARCQSPLSVPIEKTEARFPARSQAENDDDNMGVEEVTVM